MSPDFMVEVPPGLLEILERVAFVGCTGDVFDGVAEVEVEIPRIDDLYCFVLTPVVMFRVVDIVLHSSTDLLASFRFW